MKPTFGKRHLNLFESKQPQCCQYNRGDIDWLYWEPWQFAWLVASPCPGSNGGQLGTMVICLGMTPVTLDAPPSFSHRVFPHELLGRERVSLQFPASERPHGTTTEDAGYSERGPIWPWRALIFDRLVRSALVSQDVPLARWRHRGFCGF